MQKNIHTTIDEDTYRIAIINKISWSTALKFGIETMAGFDKEEQALKEELDKTKARLKYIEDALKKIIQQKEKKKKEEDQRTVLTFND